ncbi:MAG TPA: heat-inducible transcriptional repressor HrcA [Solirubrobacterales bacterium]|nr:heat-inducible transcriptional repressor HrcA [Solirubrobacterales bacterium]
MLSERRQRILSLVVDSYLRSGRPVGSRALAEHPDVEWSASTVRAELAGLERQGFLTHPHTSAGRVPSDSGYRFYADLLLASGPRSPGSSGSGLDLGRMRREVEEAMRQTTAELSRMTDLLALATAPPPSSTRIHRVEVLRLKPRAVMVVVIASNGAVTKRVFRFESPVDSGLVSWASSYLNERLAGLGLGARMIADRLADPELGPVESAFIAEIDPAFSGLEERAEADLYVEGAARLLSEDHAGDLPHADALMHALERRANLLRILRSALEERSVFVWIGEENPAPELRSVSVVGANYGLGYRNLGTVGVVGPLRMDYATAIDSVRNAAGTLSRFFETVYEG